MAGREHPGQLGASLTTEERVTLTALLRRLAQEQGITRAEPARRLARLLGRPGLAVSRRRAPHGG
jgi:hypothetical protein